MESPNTQSLSGQWERLGADQELLLRAYRSFNAYADAFHRQGDAHEH
jgi:hypothetical protein